MHQDANPACAMSRKTEHRGPRWPLATLAALLAAATVGAADGKWDLFLLFGQSNMAGPPKPEAIDKTTNSRIRVLAYDNCGGLGRTYNQWYPASPPLHECYNGVGPADWFSRTLIDTSAKLGLGIDTIGLIPCAISGVSIDMFRKGVTYADRGKYRIPPDDKLPNAYPWMVARIREAQKKGVVRGILFHQGESNPGDPSWPGKVKGIVDSLKKDLGLGDIPFIAGELRYDTLTGATNYHNKFVNQLPGLIRNTTVVSAKGLRGMPDPWHFNLVGMREFGHRYAAAMVPYLKPIPIGIAPESAARGIPGLQVHAAAGALVIRSPEPLTRAVLVGVRGESADVGAGREIRLDARRFPAGVYILHASTASGTEMRKVLL